MRQGDSFSSPLMGHVHKGRLDRGWNNLENTVNRAEGQSSYYPCPSGGGPICVPDPPRQSLPACFSFLRHRHSLATSPGLDMRGNMSPRPLAKAGGHVHSPSPQFRTYEGHLAIASALGVQGLGSWASLREPQERQVAGPTGLVGGAGPSGWGADP